MVDCFFGLNFKEWTPLTLCGIGLHGTITWVLFAFCRKDNCMHRDKVVWSWHTSTFSKVVMIMVCLVLPKNLWFQRFRRFDFRCCIWLIGLVLEVKICEVMYPFIALVFHIWKFIQFSTKTSLLLQLFLGLTGQIKTYTYDIHTTLTRMQAIGNLTQKNPL
jgi:hypothetical protein